MIIYFYPKDESAVCTKEVRSFRNSSIYFAVKERLPFTLLSDSGNIVLKPFGVKNILFLTGRETFVVGLNGKIAHSFRSLSDGSAHPEKCCHLLIRKLN